MKILLSIVGALMFSTAALAQRPDMIYIALGMYYKDGAFVNAAVVTKDGKLPTFDSSKECLEFLQESIAGAAKSGAVGANNGIIGGCVPVHRLFPGEAT